MDSDDNLGNLFGLVFKEEFSSSSGSVADCLYISNCVTLFGRSG